MTDTPIISSTGPSFLATQTAKLTKAVGDVKNSFATALNRAEVTVGLKPKAGFISGPTYQATTLAGQTQAAINNTIHATKSALHIK